MKFYGVGVQYGRKDDKLSDFQKFGFWCMGHDTHEKFEEVISNVNTGDVVFAKSFIPENPRHFYIRAIGFVSDISKLPDNVPNEYKSKRGFSVVWTTSFEKRLDLEPSDNFMSEGFMKVLGNVRTGTIYHETNKEMILKIVETMNGPYYK